MIDIKLVCATHNYGTVTMYRGNFQEKNPFTNFALLQPSAKFMEGGGH